jgi:hypothetical protein
VACKDVKEKQWPILLLDHLLPLLLLKKKEKAL